MRNLWIQTEDAFATWHVDLTAIAAAPDRLREVIGAVLAAGVRHRVFAMVAAPRIGFPAIATTISAR